MGSHETTFRVPAALLSGTNPAEYDDLLRVLANAADDADAIAATFAPNHEMSGSVLRVRIGRRTGRSGRRSVRVM
jgi:hypothetical protein